MTHRVVVLGAGYAGLTAARRLNRRLRNLPAQVVVINQSSHFVERIRLHQLATGQTLPATRIDVPDLVVGTAHALDLDRRQVHVDDRRVGYDTLVYALGSETDRDTIPGVRKHAHTLANPAEAVRLANDLAQLPPAAHVVVVGGGLTGIELTAEIAQQHPHLHVELVAGQEVGNWLSSRARDHLHGAFDTLSIRVRDHAVVTEVHADSVLLAGGRSVPAALIVWAAGFRVPPLARDAGLAVNEHGRLVVDDHLRSISHSEVYGIGDAAAVATRDGAVGRMSCQTSLPMGAYVAGDILRRLRGRPTPPARIRYVWQNISLGRRDALTQFTRGDDVSLNVALTGRPSALFKELISASAVWTARW